MARKRNGLVPAGEASGSLDGPVKAIRETSPQARHHFTQADQVNQQAVRTQKRELVLGKSLAEFMRTLGIYHNSGGRGGVQTRLLNQMDRLFPCKCPTDL